MPREIKFRAWDKESKTMVFKPDADEFGYIKLFNDGSGTLILEEENGEVIKGIDLENLKLMQFTGLYDKHGKEIYEGDIVKHTAVEKYNPNHSRNQLRVVEWRDQRFDDGTLPYELGWDFRYLGKGLSTIFKEEDIEIIGNIYENLELLK